MCSRYATKYMKESEQKLSRRLARSLDEIAAMSLDVSIDELLRKYEIVEQTFLLQVADNPCLISETRRRIAEMKLFSAIDRNVVYETCENLFGDVLTLDFSNLEKKSNIYLIFSRYCLQLRKEEKAKRILSEICIDLENALCSRRSHAHKEILRQAKILLAAFD
jgi:hypothetical protein